MTVEFELELSIEPVGTTFFVFKSKLEGPHYHADAVCNAHRLKVSNSVFFLEILNFSGPFIISEIQHHPARFLAILSVRRRGSCTCMARNE